MSARIRIGDNFVEPNVTETNSELESTRYQYSQSTGFVNNVRVRALDGVPTGMIESYLFGDHPENPATQEWFSIVQQSPEHVPVFILPATDNKTSDMTDEKRALHMNAEFEKCYLVYSAECKKAKVDPVSKECCAVTVVAGTKTLLGNDHYTAMIKRPGGNWMHVDPMGFLGPQRINWRQCGGYSSMIEAEAIIHYSTKKIREIVEAKSDSTKNKPSIEWGWLKSFLLKLKFKFGVHFAGWGNTLKLNSEGKKISNASSILRTSYAQMADFSARRIAKSFKNQEFLDQRMGIKSESTTDFKSGPK